MHTVCVCENTCVDECVPVVVVSNGEGGGGWVQPSSRPSVWFHGHRQRTRAGSHMTASGHSQTFQDPKKLQGTFCCLDEPHPPPPHSLPLNPTAQHSFHLPAIPSYTPLQFKSAVEIWSLSSSCAYGAFQGSIYLFRAAPMLFTGNKQTKQASKQDMQKHQLKKNQTTQNTGRQCSVV